MKLLKISILASVTISNKIVSEKSERCDFLIKAYVVKQILTLGKLVLHNDNTINDKFRAIITIYNN